MPVLKSSTLNGMHRLSWGVDCVCNVILLVASIIGVLTCKFRVKLCCDSSSVQHDQKQHCGTVEQRSALGELQTLWDVALINS